MPEIGGFGAPTPALVRLPLPRLVPRGSKIVMQVNGSVLAPVGSVDSLYIGPNGYTTDPDEATDLAPTVTEEQILIQSPGAPGKSAYDLWLAEGHEGSQQEFLNSLRGASITPTEIDASVAQYLLANSANYKGDKGNPGIDGKDGAPGKDGKDGLAGSQGTPGTPGKDGKDGSKGDKGDKGDAGNTLIGTVSVGQTATVAISAGIRTVTVTVNGVVAGKNYLLFPIDPLPLGYGIHNVVATANNTLQVTLYAPLLAIGAAYSIAFRVVQVNT